MLWLGALQLKRSVGGNFVSYAHLKHKLYTFYENVDEKIPSENNP